ncbi:MAG TPA: hypothetical protein VJR04_00940 [Terriglobales bacterium]|nr:hypothetical protein [Terriglobales bacterium]
MRRIFALLPLLWLAFGICAHADSTPQPKVPIPESGYLSAHEYTNAYFGFTIQLPKSGNFQVRDFSEKNNTRIQHYLLSQSSSQKDFVEWSITATQVFKDPDMAAEKAVIFRDMPKQDGPQALSIGRHLFWKSEAEKTDVKPKLYQLRYATGIGGFVVQFSVYSYSGRLKEELRQNIESMKFFPPADLKQELAKNAQPYLPEAARWWLTNAPQLQLAGLDTGTLFGTKYVNSDLGFSYLFPNAWRIAVGDPSDAKGQHEAAPASAGKLSEQCIRVLASAAQNSGDGQSGFNPRIVIAAADPACYAPGEKYPESELDHTGLQVFGASLIRAFAGSPLMGRTANTVRAAEIGNHLFFEIPSSTSAPIIGSALRRKIHMLFVLTEIKNYWVIWLLESDTESELGSLLKTSISFDPSQTHGTMR